MTSPFRLTSRYLFISPCVRIISPIIFRVIKGPSSSSANFKHPKLSPEEMRMGCKLGLDSWADTCCAGKHAHVIEFVEGRSVTARGFASSLDPIHDLSIANVAYAYDMPSGETLILVINNSIYLGALMDDSLLNPIQCMTHGIQIDIRPRSLVGDVDTAQTFRIPSLDVILPIEYHGVLPFLSVRRPTHEELSNCTHVCLTSDVGDWDPYDPSSSLFPISITQGLPDFEDICHDHHPLDERLLNRSLGMVLTYTRTLYECSSSSSGYATIGRMATRAKDKLSPEQLARLWRIGIKTAERTLHATSHQCLRTTGILTRWFRTDQAHLRYKQLSTHHGQFYTDYLKSSVKSIRGFIGRNIYVNKLGFKKFFPMATEQGAESGATLRSFIQMVGIPRQIHSDNHKNFSQGEFSCQCKKFHIPQTFTEAHSPWQNRAEPAINEVKSYARRLMMHTQTPIRLWCFCYEYAADLLSLCATGRFDLQGRTSYEHVVGYTPDITEYVTFSWFQWCWYWDEDIKQKKMCRWLGPAHRIGQALCFYLLLDTGNFIARSTVIPIPDEDLGTDIVKDMQRRYTECVESHIGNSKQPLFNDAQPDAIYYLCFDDDLDADANAELLDSELFEAPTADQDEAYFEDLDEYINAQVLLPDRTSGSNVLARVKKRKCHADNSVVGTANPNPILDTRVYELEFPDGRVEEYAANVIAEALHAQVDDDGYDAGILDEIVDHRCDTSQAVPPDKATFVTRAGVERPVITTKGWDLQVRWKDGSYSWLPLSLLKESNPVLTAEYAVARDIANAPAFAWWVKHVLRRRDRIINQTQTRCRKGRLKFGVKVPQDIDEAKRLDEANGNCLWQDAIEKEFENSRIAFELLGEGDRPPPGWKEISCHLVFDVKFDLRHKARYVAGGHLTKDPGVSCYASVVSRESVRIGFLVAALNGLDILAGDIQNAYLHAPSLEKNFFYAGDEWGANQGRVVLIVRALYGQKSAGAAWRAHLADTISSKMGFESSLADPDVWRKPAVKPNGEKYYTYIFIYTDDVLIMDLHPHTFMKQLQSNYPVKKDSIESPKMYLGADIHQLEWQSASGETVHCWSMGSNSYVKEAMRNVKERLKKDDLRFDPKLSDPKISAPQPFSTQSYLPELDTSAPCNDAQAQYYQNLIGVLRWIVELGRIDINYEVSVLSRYLAAPRTGHLQQALHIFKYLDIHSDNELAFDPTYLQIMNPTGDSVESKIANMRQRYPDAEEALPPDAPEPRGRPVQINCFVDADHAGNRATRRSQTGILIYLNTAPIIWYSKRQTSVETSTFGSEFVALKTATELIIALRYKLRMFGIPIEGPANVMCDNEAMYKSASIADSRLKKKSQSICYHKVREAISAGIQMIFKESTDSNLADILTKSLPPHKRLALRRLIMVSCNSNVAHS